MADIHSYGQSYREADLARVRTQTSLGIQIAALDKAPPDLESIVDDLARVAKRTVEALRDEAKDAKTTDGLPARVNRDFVSRLREASMAVATAVKAQNDLHRTAASRAQSLTSEQRQVALYRAILDLDYGDRRNLVLAILEAHNGARQAWLDSKVAGTLEVDPRTDGRPVGKIFVDLL